MAARKSGDDGRRKRQAANGRSTRRRKPNVPPIIDLEAVIVEDNEPAPNDDAAAADAAGRDQAGASRKDQNSVSWMEEMKRFFLGGVHIGRWRVPAAGSLIVLAIFIAGLIGGWYFGPEARVSGPSAASDQRMPIVETALKDIASANTAIAARLEDLSAKVETVGEHARLAQTAADAALSEVRTLDAGLAELSANDSTSAAPANKVLQEQIGKLAAKIDALAQIPSATNEQALPKDLDARIAALSTAVADLKRATEQMAARQTPAQGVDGVDTAALLDAVRAQVRDSMADVVTRLDALETARVQSSQTAPSPVARAASDLQKAVDAGQPYQPQLAAFAAVMPGDPAITAIAAHAPGGVFPRLALAAQFEEIALDLTTSKPGSEETSDGDGNLIDNVWSRVNDLVDVRKSTEPGSRMLVEAVTAAREHVERDELARAADALSAAGEGLTQAAEKWIREARARSKVDREMNGLLRRALAMSDKSGS